MQWNEVNFNREFGTVKNTKQLCKRQLVRVIYDGREGEIIDIYPDATNPYVVALEDGTTFSCTENELEPVLYVNEKQQKGLKHDQDKLRYDLVLPELEEAVAEVLTFGAKKYAPNSWQQVENGGERYYAALKRHLAEWRKGNFIDEESGLSHMAHIACNVMFLMYFDRIEGRS